jgi:hypothetical protein
MSEQFHTEFEFDFSGAVRVEGFLVAGACIVTYDLNRQDRRESPTAEEVELICIGDVRVDWMAASEDELEQDGWGYVTEGSARWDVVVEALRPLVEEHLRDNVERWFSPEAA